MSITEVVSRAEPPRSGYRRRGSAPNLRIVCDASPPPLPPVPTMHLFSARPGRSHLPPDAALLPAWLSENLDDPARLGSTFDVLEYREGVRASAARNTEWYRSTEGKTSANMMRSRYFNIVPYDLTRVKLPDRGRDDFVNASWIEEPFLGVGTSQQKWIASQGPLPETLNDYFSLFTDLDDRSRPQVIIQLTACYESNREKSAPYVPDAIESSLTFPAYVPKAADRNRGQWVEADGAAAVEVTLARSVWASGKVWRENDLVVKKAGHPERLVKHFECTVWKDHGVPDAPGPIVELLDRAEQVGQGRPIVVHCSAGVGRTGTLIAIAALKRKVDALKAVGGHARAGGPGDEHPGKQGAGKLPAELASDPVAVTVDGLRDQRVAMVQTPEQLRFIYEATAQLWQP